MQTVVGAEWKDQESPEDEIKVGKANKRQVLLGSGSLVLAAVEAICLFLVTANGLTLVLGTAAIGLAQGAAFFHSATIRIPLLALATLGASLNLWLLVNAWRLRQATAARWRKRPLLPKERRRIILISALSILTLSFVAAELFLHHKLHGSAFASCTDPAAQFEPNRLRA